MDPMTDDGAMADGGGAGAPGAMRVVMLNARTAVLVPVGSPDPVAPGEDEGWTEEAGDTASVPAGMCEGSSAGSAPPEDASPIEATACESNADTPAVAPGSLVDDDASDVSQGSDASAEWGHADDTRSASQGPEVGQANEPGDAIAPDARWKAELLARLDDLGRLLARGAVQNLSTSDGGAGSSVAALAAAVERLEARMTSDLAGMAARLDQLEAEMTRSGAGASSPPDLAEAISDLRMQVRMVEVQVGTLGKLMVSAAPTETAAPDMLRTRLAELMASEQRLAAGD